MAKTITTEILIDATPQQVWQVLTDFKGYPMWNPFIKSLKGEVKEGNTIEVIIHPPNGNAMTFKPLVLAYQTAKEFRWKGKLFMQGLFDGEHSFVLQEENGKTRLLHSETFTGILVPLLWGMLQDNTTKGFEMMNEAIKTRASI